MQGALWVLFWLKLAWNVGVVYDLARRQDRGSAVLIPFELALVALLVGTSLMETDASWLSPGSTALVGLLAYIGCYPVMVLGDSVGTWVRRRRSGSPGTD